jgi:hypothetical protein
MKKFMLKRDLSGVTMRAVIVAPLEMGKNEAI